MVTARRCPLPIAISVGHKPVPRIRTPANGFVFRAGDTIAFSGDATDAEDGSPCPPVRSPGTSTSSTRDTCIPALPQTGDTSGPSPFPTSGHDFSGNTRYRITLTVTDSDGLQASTSVEVFPDKVNLTFDTVPSGLDITLDGIPRPTPFVYDTLIGFHHTIGAPNQTVGQNVYTFASWSDGGAQQHLITGSGRRSRYVATYTVSQNPLPTGLVAGYRFSEGAGATTADVSGNNNTGTLVNGPAWTTGQYGGLSLQRRRLRRPGEPRLAAADREHDPDRVDPDQRNPVDDGAIVAKLGDVGWQLKTSADTGARTAAIRSAPTAERSIQRYSGTVLATGPGTTSRACTTPRRERSRSTSMGARQRGAPRDDSGVAVQRPLDVNIAQRAGSRCSSTSSG